jgi:uncharacterized membrane protein YqjE
MENGAPDTGWLASLRRFADGLLASVQDRLQLLAIELNEEKLRLIQILVWIAAIVSLGFLAVIFASLVLLVLFWETARVPVAIGLAVAYGGSLAAAIIGFRRFLARQPVPFSATLRELQKDRECIRTEK